MNYWKRIFELKIRNSNNNGIGKITEITEKVMTLINI